ncbi:MAG: M56 family metallopeptidase [Petrimonas sp.]|nr:M56 family metallopeptidase [Petrimonas sp.]
MEALLTYLLKVNVGLIVFYLLYVVMFRKDTFIKMRRYFFLSAMAFSVLYPLVSVEALGNLYDFQAAFVQTQETVEVGEPNMVVLGENESAGTPFISLRQALYWLAAAGTAFFLIRFLWQIFSILRIRSRSEKKMISGLSVYHLPDDITPFSFFNWIFVHAESHSREELTQILLHEQTHAHQRHSVDIVLAELLCIFFWWNPFVWLMKKEMAINLEYLADNGVLREGVNTKAYQYHLLRLTYHETAVQIVNNFNVSQLKQRIMMMNKSKSPTAMMAKYLMILPLALLLVTINSCANKEKKTPPDETAEVTAPQTDSIVDATDITLMDKSEVFVVVENQPEFPGGTPAMMKFLKDSVKYPVEAQEKGIEGRVITNFVVEKDGRLSDFNVVRGIDPSLDKEALRVLKAMPNWKPGTQRGQNVRVRFTLPVVFRLMGDKKTTSAPPPPPPPPTSAEKKSLGSAPPPPPPPPAYSKSREEMKNTNEVFVVVEKQPEFPGGTQALMKFINENVNYPREAQENGIQGRPIVNFIVEKDGTINDVKIVRSVDPLLDAEALRVAESMPKWSPGKQKGQPVRVRYTLPLVFRLQQ